MEGKDVKPYQLKDMIWPIEDKIEKANLMIGDVQDDFFRKYDPDKEEDINYMRYCFRRYCLQNDIAWTLIWEALNEIKELDKMLDICLEQIKENEGKLKKEDDFISLDVVTFNV